MAFVTTYGPALPPGQSASPGKAALQSGFAMRALFAKVSAKPPKCTAFRHRCPAARAPRRGRRQSPLASDYTAASTTPGGARFFSTSALAPGWTSPFFLLLGCTSCYLGEGGQTGHTVAAIPFVGDHLDFIIFSSRLWSQDDKPVANKDLADFSLLVPVSTCRQQGLSRFQSVGPSRQRPRMIYPWAPRVTYGL